MKFILRLDDACETMNFENWERIENLLDKYNIKPLVAVIPNNQDVSLMYSSFNDDFWNLTKKWQNKSWELALHGNSHVYETNSGGINPIQKRSEFAGLPFHIQQKKIKEGYLKLKNKGLYPRVFVAPSHTFDENTLKALYLETPIRIISDTIAFNLYKEGDFIFIPQQFGSVRNIPINGIYTFCYHPNTMNEKSFRNLEEFIKKNQNRFTSIDVLNFDVISNKKLIDKIYSFSYFLFRKLFR